MTAPRMLRASRHCVWHWLCWVVLGIASLPVCAVVDVPAERPAVPLWQALAWQPEPAGAQVPADMVGATGFRVPPAYPNWGFAPGRPHWFRFSLRNPGPQPQARLLHIDFPLLDHVQLFAPDGQGGYTESRTGDTEPWGARPLALRQLALPFVLPPGEHDFYLRVASSSNLLIPAQVHSPASFWALMSRQQLIEGAFYGAMALVLLYNLFLFASARERIFLYYVFALLPTLGYLFILDGFGFALVPVPGLWQNLSISVCIGLANLAYLQFARHFLNLPAASAWARSSRVLMACCLVSVLLLPVLGPSWGAVLVLLMGVLVSMFMLAMGLAALQQGRREALYFVLGWSLFLVNAVAAVLSVFALVPWFAFFITGIKLGLLWTVSWLSLGLGLYLRRLKAESLRSREQVLRAEAQSQAKSQFLAMMSHEIRTPMNGVLGMAELLRTTGLSAEQVRILDTMEASGNALLEVINDVLDHAKIESGRMDLELVTLDLDRLVEEALALFSARIYKQQLTLLCSIAPDVPTEIEGDALRLRQVLTNLLSNAVKFTAHGQIELAIEAFGEGEQVGLRFMFRDTGIGIAPEQLPHIFDSFVQEDVSTSRRYGGSGLGLSISRDLCRLMGGDLSVQSAPGQGSVFTATVRARRMPGARPRQAWPAELAPLRLLLVDGDMRFCEVMAREAASAALAIETAPSGEAALARLRAAAQAGQPFDLLATALQLPDMNGLSLHERVGREPALASIRTLLFALPQLQPSPGVLAHAGVAHAFERPVLARELRQAVLAVVRQRDEDRPVTRAELPQYPGLRVLVAEDNRTNQVVIQGLLRRFGIQAALAENGEQVLLALQRQHFDLVLMDCEMPVMDGYSATREIRRREAADGRGRMPILAISAHVTQHHVDNCYAAGMDDHLPKPVNLRMLGEKLAQWAPVSPGLAVTGGQAGII